MQSDEGQDLLYDSMTYRMLFVERFEDVLDDPIAELKDLKETNGIVDYHGKFDSCACEAFKGLIVQNILDEYPKIGYC